MSKIETWILYRERKGEKETERRLQENEKEEEEKDIYLTKVYMDNTIIILIFTC